MRPRRLAALLTLPQVADLMQLTGRNRIQRLRRQLKRIERRTQTTILVHNGQAGTSSRYMVSIPLLREHHPHFFYRRDEAADALREHIERMEDVMSALRRRVDDVARECGSRIRRVEDQLRAQRGASAGTGGRTPSL